MMKKNKLLTKLILLTVMLVGGASGVWADDVCTATQTLSNNNKTCTWTSLNVSVAKNSTAAGNGLYFVAGNDGSITTSSGTVNIKSGRVMYVEVPSASSTGSITIVGTDDKSDRSVSLLSGSTIAMAKSGNSANFVSTDIENVNGGNYIKVTSNSDFKFNQVSVTLTSNEVYVLQGDAPSDLTFSPAAGSIGAGTEITLSASGATSIKWQWGNAAVTSADDASWASAQTYTDTNKPAAGAVGSKDDVLSILATNDFGSAVASATYTFTAPQVATPTITAAAYFMESQTVEIACSDENATIKYSIDGGSTWNNYSAALTLTETTTVQAKAVREGYTDSEIVSATYTKITLDTQTTVTGTTTWDWSEITSGDVQLGDPLSNQDVLFSNISKYGYTITAPSTFNQQALIVNCQYAVRDANGSKFTQANSIKFTTEVEGNVTVEYANTGNNAARTVIVNSVKGTKSSTANNSYQSETFSVSAGSVTISGVEVGESGTAKMLRIRKVIFEVPVADETAPSFVSSTPASGATDVAVEGNIILTFNEAIATVDATKFTLSGATIGNVAIDSEDNTKVNVAYSGAGNEATVTLSVDAGAVADAAGNASAALSDISFTTKPEAATLTAVSDYMWTFDGDNWESSYAQNSEEVVANNLGILASNKDIAIDENSKTMDGYSFSKRLKLGGEGSATTQNVHFKVAGACKITVYGMSGKSSDTRPLGITANDVEEATDFPGDRLYKAVYYYTGTTATDVYVYSKNSGINIYGIKVEPITDASVTISSAKFASFSDGVARDFSATGITVYTAKATGTSVKLTEVTDGIVPANTGVVLYSESEVTEAVPMVTTTKTTLEDNEMVANVSGAKVALAGEDGKTNYILSNEDAGVGFYKAAANGAYLPANRAYLSTTATASTAPFLGFDGNETTGINSVERGALSVEGCYTLDGRRVAQPTKGLYIVNGRKVIIK